MINLIKIAIKLLVKKNLFIYRPQESLQTFDNTDEDNFLILR